MFNADRQFCLAQPTWRVPANARLHGALVDPGMSRNLPRPGECFEAAPSNATPTIRDSGEAALQRRASYSIEKLALDYGIALLALVLLAPLLLIIAVAIKLESPGPVLFRQPRRGLNNRNFTVFKFRSMYTEFTDIEAIRQTSRNDPRVTRVGKWLRRLSFDEFPQFLNVLRGEMSLVGPRPHAPNMRVEGELLEVASSDYLLRYSVKPGITGWAQVNGIRGQLARREDLRKRIDYDLEYIRRRSLGFDLKILALTLWREIFSRNAF